MILFWFRIKVIHSLWRGLNECVCVCVCEREREREGEEAPYMMEGP